MSTAAFAALLAFAVAAPDLAPRAGGFAAHPPDVFLALAAYLGTRARGRAAVGWAAAAGAAQDCASIDALGTHAFVLGTVAFLLAGRRWEGRGARWLGTALACVGAALLECVRALPVPGAPPAGAAWSASLASAPWTLALAVPLHALLDRTRALDGCLGRGHGLAA